MSQWRAIGEKASSSVGALAFDEGMLLAAAAEAQTA
jgi:hypothetical protein